MGSSIELDSGKHVTWDYTGGSLPDDVKEGDVVEVTVHGIYIDDACSSYICSIFHDYQQPKTGVLLHITMYVNGIDAVEAGLRPTLLGYKKTKPFVLNGIWSVKPNK